MELLSIIVKYLPDLSFWVGFVCGGFVGYKYAAKKLIPKNSFSYAKTFYCKVINDSPTNIIRDAEFISTNCPYHKSKKIFFFKRHICAKTGKRCDAPEFI